ncbi:MAG: deoxyguanosinetriphosphate triphosphohydrolase [Microbacteriaceae bacterium]|nr:deoxyguanosinetriphosphate triphosphohydrolase [Microbacteriaceae bacterium]
MTLQVASSYVYQSEDLEQFVPETHRSSRSAFTRDRARIVHSSALRRLSMKTQVHSPLAGLDSARNRLTHSLEVAQIGREMAGTLGLDPDIVDSACLAHDLGHPPFGHNGEKAVALWAEKFGGFEGNAQTLRVLVRLEPKTFDAEGQSRGLNLTRATLDACIKYPWAVQDELAQSSKKFGFYQSDSEIYEWIRAHSLPRQKSAEAQLMDLADDIAYSVHDFEDAVVSGFIDPLTLLDPGIRDALIRDSAEWVGTKDLDGLALALESLSALPSWPKKWSGTFQEHAMLKDLTSSLIGRFATSVQRASESQKVLGRFEGSVIRPYETDMEIDLLKGIVASFVMNLDTRQQEYERQREIIIELADWLWEHSPSELEPIFKEAFERADSEIAARRAIIDQVASLTDRGAIDWHSRIRA